MTLALGDRVAFVLNPARTGRVTVLRRRSIRVRLDRVEICAAHYVDSIESPRRMWFRIPEEDELECGCSPRAPCSTAAPFFRHHRSRKLYFHLRASFARTFISPRRAHVVAKKHAPPPIANEPPYVAASETNAGNEPKDSSGNETNHTEQ